MNLKRLVDQNIQILLKASELQFTFLTFCYKIFTRSFARVNEIQKLKAFLRNKVKIIQFYRIACISCIGYIVVRNFATNNSYKQQQYICDCIKILLRISARLQRYQDQKKIFAYCFIAILSEYNFRSEELWCMDSLLIQAFQIQIQQKSKKSSCVAYCCS